MRVENGIAVPTYVMPPMVPPAGTRTVLPKSVLSPETVMALKSQHTVVPSVDKKSTFRRAGALAPTYVANSALEVYDMDNRIWEYEEDFSDEAPRQKVHFLGYSQVGMNREIYITGDLYQKVYDEIEARLTANAPQGVEIWDSQIKEKLRDELVTIFDLNPRSIQEFGKTLKGARILASQAKFVDELLASKVSIPYTTHGNANPVSASRYHPYMDDSGGKTKNYYPVKNLYMYPYRQESEYVKYQSALATEALIFLGKNMKNEEVYLPQKMFEAMCLAIAQQKGVIVAEQAKYINELKEELTSIFQIRDSLHYG